MDTQHYQPLSAALVTQPNLLQTDRSPQQHYPPNAYHPYAPQASPTNGTYQHPSTAQREEEEEEANDDDDEDLEHDDRDHPSPSAHSSPRVAAGHPAKPPGPTASSSHYSAQASAPAHDPSQITEDSKRKPGRPRGSRNRRPRAAPNSSTKAPTNSQHPGFYQYPPPPPATAAPNQQFYEFQWRALNLCSEFYNAAEELIKAASPVVISQCYQSGPGPKIDPMALIADAKRVCDNLLANPSQLVGQPPPPAPSYPTVTGYASMPPPPAPGSVPPASASNASGSVISNPQSFVMPLSAPAAPYPPQPYYPPPGYPAPGPGSRYPTAPYYPYPPAASPYYPAAPQPQPQSAPTSTPPAPPPASTSNTGTPASAASTSTPTAPVVPPGNLSTFNASTGNTAPGGTQGAWSTEETNRLKDLADRSREMGGAQSKGEIEWDWVVQQWGNSRTRHQILLKATSLGLKESTTRGTKRRRADEANTDEQQPQRTAPAAPTNASQSVSSLNPSSTYAAPPSTGVSPGQSSATASNPPSANASPATQPQRPPSSSTTAMPGPTTARSTTGAGLAWPMPTIAANTPSPVMANTTIDPTRNYYRRPAQPQTQQQQQTAYAMASPVMAASPTNARPPSSHGPGRSQHPYMFSPPQGHTTTPSGRRENGM